MKWAPGGLLGKILHSHGPGLVGAFAKVLTFSNLDCWVLRGPPILKEEFIFCLLHLTK